MKKKDLEFEKIEIKDEVRTTITFSKNLYKNLKKEAIEKEISLSELINEKLKDEKK